MFVTIDGIIPTATSRCHCCPAWPMMLLILATSSGLPDNIASCKSACLPQNHSCNSSTQFGTKSCRLHMRLETLRQRWNTFQLPAIGHPSLATAEDLLPRRLVKVVKTAAFVSTLALPHHSCSHSLWCASHPPLLDVRGPLTSLTLFLDVQRTITSFTRFKTTRFRVVSTPWRAANAASNFARSCAAGVPHLQISEWPLLG